MIPTMNSGKHKTMETVKGSVVVMGLEGKEGEKEQVEHMGFLGQCNYSVWYCNGKYTALRICQNPQNVRNGEWTMDFS